jgi:parallel beta-helix repeat protein
LLCLLLLLSCLSYARYSQTEVKASSSLPVHNLNTGLNYTTIQDAINANETLDGHTIFVDAGVYNESLLINKSVSLKGENKDDTILNATFQITPLFDLEAAMVNITASNVEIAGFNLTGWYFNQISASSCSNITIRDNIVTSGGTCIALSNANNCTVADNIIVGDGLEGNNLVVLASCSGCIIRNNTIEYACYEGIRLVNSNNNLIYENLISDNQYGIDFYNGLDTGNTIFHNNFEGNYHQLIGAGGNYFNESFEGNYWSDYEGKDVNQDGIGDTPYANLDFYPLVGAFQDFAVLSPTDGLQSITIISNSTVTDLSLDYYVPTNDSVQSDEPFIKFSVTGQNGTIGFCRLMIPNAIMNSSSYIVFVNNEPVNVKQLLISNSTVAYLYFTYSQSTRQVLVFVPEFPSFLILPLFFITTLFSAIIYEKRRQNAFSMPQPRENAITNHPSKRQKS